MHKVEINAVQMKFIREFFDNYQDEKVKLAILDDKIELR